MSYCRGTVYIIKTINGRLECCGCSLADPKKLASILVDGPTEMLEHIKEHEAVGQKVPFHAILRLRKEVSGHHCVSEVIATQEYDTHNVTVYWCPSCKLTEIQYEYEEHELAEKNNQRIYIEDGKPPVIERGWYGNNWHQYVPGKTEEEGKGE